MLKVLKFLVKFYATSADTVESSRRSVEDFFKRSNQKYKGVEVKSCSVHRIVGGCFYEENFYEVQCLVCHSGKKNSPDFDVYTYNVCKEWCDRQLNKIFFKFWLIPSRHESFCYEESRCDRNMKTKEFAFGTMPFMANFVEHYCYKEKSRKSEIMASFLHSLKYFVVYFSVVHNPGCSQSTGMYRLRFPYKSLQRIVVHVCSGSEPTDLYFHLDHYPLVYCLQEEERMSEDVSSKCVDIVSRVSKAEYCPEKWERTLHIGCTCNDTGCSIKRLGRCNVFKITMSDKFRVRYVVYRLVEQCDRRLEVCYCSVQTTKLSELCKEFEDFPTASCCRLGNVPQQKHVMVDMFKCQYSWKSLLCHSFVVHDQIYLSAKNDPEIWNTLRSKLLSYSHTDCEALCKALFIISEAVRKNMLLNFEIALSRLFNILCKKEKYSDLPDGLCLVRRIIITPSKMLFLPPVEHFENRIIRKFGEEFILRVSVLDDNLMKLTFAVHHHSKRKEFIRNTVGDILLYGIVIGCRVYKVLASSNSQLREHGMWLFAKDLLGNTAASIREWMGDFSHIRSVAKYMARMGQCFSTSNQAVQLALDSTDEISLEEVTFSSPNTAELYVFSDGAGTISSSLASEVRNALQSRFGESNQYYKPSAFQIRYKGCKGVVTEDPKIKGRKLGIRPSMKKFECTTSSHLEVVKASAPRRLFLNRPLITILEQMGVPGFVFLRLQQDMMLQLIKALLYEMEAAKLMNMKIFYSLPYDDLYSAGISVINEPFFRSLLLCTFRALVENLHQKMRIAVPAEYGRNMLGVMDETGLLNYGQVFVQYTENISYSSSSNLIILRGPVIVTKNPCMHPGDVRKLVAVDIPDLRHIKDCIVFPSCGERPHPNEMAGSDLDGDEFIVIWHPDLVFKRGNYPAMHYPLYREKVVTGKIGTHEMVEFFCDYIINDNIGVFASAHLAWADQHPEGIFSDVCMRIAKKYPFVLDFAKTGRTEYLTQNERPQQYPDFMQKGSTSDSYRSRRILGLLYQASRHLEVCVDKIYGVTSVQGYDHFLEYPEWEKYCLLAENHRLLYCEKLQNILNTFGAQSEAEVLCGYVKGQLFNQSRQEKESVMAVARRYLSDLMQKYRTKFFEEVQSEWKENQVSSDEEKVHIQFKMASAWYMVTYRSDCQLLSFPWVLSDILSEMRKKLIKNQNITFVRDAALGDLDVKVTNFLRTDDEESDTCFCVSAGKYLLRGWFKYTELNECPMCHDRIVSHFLLHTEEKLLCQNSCCSPVKFCVSLLKFYFSHVNDFIGMCKDGCLGFKTTKLQAVALQTLVNLLVTRDLRYLCPDIQFEDGSSIPNDGSICDIEGDVVRVPVRTSAAKQFVSDNMFWIKEYLQIQSGVSKIYIESVKDAKENCFLLLNSVGRDWQRWHLESLVQDPLLFENLERAFACSQMCL